MKIRINKDVTFRWTIKINGAEVDLRGKNLKIYVTNPYKKRDEVDFLIVAPNVLVFRYKNNIAGQYILTCTLNEDEVGESAVDNKDFVLVPYSFDEDDHTEESLDIEEVEIEGDIETGGGGLDPENYYTKYETDILLEGKQDLLTAGEGISIEDNVISCTLEADVTKEYVDNEIARVEGEIPDISYLATKTELNTGLATKQDTISDLNTIRSGAALGATALQEVPDTYATKQWVENKEYLTEADIEGKADKTYVDEELDSINEKIPSEATVSNKLADKNFVNSSIATNTAYFIGTFDSLEELEEYSGPKTNNDYAFVIGEDEHGNTQYNRYKWNTIDWTYEYTLNNSSFTAAQWATINSGLTSQDKTDIATALSLIATKQNILTAGHGITISNDTISSDCIEVVNYGILSGDTELAKQVYRNPENYAIYNVGYYSIATFHTQTTGIRTFKSNLIETGTGSSFYQYTITITSAGAVSYVRDLIARGPKIIEWDDWTEPNHDYWEHPERYVIHWEDPDAEDTDQGEYWFYPVKRYLGGAAADPQVIVHYECHDFSTNVLTTYRISVHYTGTKPSYGVEKYTQLNIAGKQNVLTAGENITIVNDVISSTGGGGNVVELTQEEYDELETKDPETNYIITDAEEIDMNDYALESEFTGLRTVVNTKANATNVSAKTSGYQFPNWNNQGVITGNYSTWYSASFNANGSSRSVLSSSSSALNTVYGPTTAGTANQVCVSSGSGAPVWTNASNITGGLTMVCLTQDEYEELETKDPNSLYIIKEDE